MQPDGSVPKDTDWGPCNSKFSRDFPIAAENRWFYTMAYTLIPVPIVWLLIYAVVGLVRWVRAGFTPQN